MYFLMIPGDETFSVLSWDVFSKRIPLGLKIQMFLKSFDFIGFPFSPFTLIIVSEWLLTDNHQHPDMFLFRQKRQLALRNLLMLQISIIGLCVIIKGIICRTTPKTICYVV